MGTSGTGIFADDFACDVRDDYVALLADGNSDSNALAAMLQRYRESIGDDDEGPVFWFALAATQWKYGRLQPRVKAKALAIINRGGDIHRWTSTRDVSRRQRVLSDLKTKLQSEQPKRRSTPSTVAQPSLTTSVPSPDNMARVSVTEHEPNSKIPAVVVWIHVVDGNGLESGRRVLHAPARLSDIRLSWRHNRLLEVCCPNAMTPHQKEDKAFGIDVVYTSIESVSEPPTS